MSQTDDNKPKNPAWLEALALGLANVPVIGSPIAAFLKASWEVKRLILLAVLILAVYPTFAVISAIYVIQFLPDGTRHWIQRLADQTFDVDGRIDNSNVVIDGSTLMDFDLVLSSATDGVVSTDFFVEPIATDQPFHFLAYIKETPAPYTGDPAKQFACMAAGLPRPTPDGGLVAVGQLQVTSKGSSGASLDSFDVTNNVGLADVAEFDANWWTARKAKERARLPDAWDISVSFQPEGKILDVPAHCHKYKVFVVMIYNKKNAKVVK